MSNFSNEQIALARKANLFNFILNHYETDYTLEGDTLHPRTDHNISIKKGYGEYKDSNRYGNAIDYLVFYLHYEFDEAVSILLDEGDAKADRPKSPKTHMKSYTNEPALFPNRAETNEKIATYLTTRGISNETIEMLIKKGLIYQDENENVVFINNEWDWGEIRGTDTLADYKCIHDCWCDSFWDANDDGLCECSAYCKRYKQNKFRSIVKNSRRDGFWWFQTGTGPAEKVFICEAAIDAISLYEINRKTKRNQNAVYISIGGVAKQPAINRIKKHKGATLAVDNDEAGETCRNRNPDIKFIIPHTKDWNEDLVTNNF